MHFDGSSSMSIEMAIHLVEQLALPAFLINKQGQIVAWNAACTELTGVSKETVQTSGQHNQAFFSNEQVNLSTLILEHRQHEINHYFKGHQVKGSKRPSYHVAAWFNLPFRNEAHFLEVDAFELFDENEESFAILECFNVMTARELAVKRFRRLFELSPDPVWIIEDNMFVDCNDAAVAMLGYPSKASLINTHPSKLSPIFQADGKTSFEKAEEMMGMALMQGLHRFEWIHQRFDGSVFDAEVTLAKIELNNQTAIYCTWRDISDRKKNLKDLQLYAAVFHNNADAILITDRENNVVAINHALSEISGYSKEELIGKNPRILGSGFTNRDTYQVMWDALTQKGSWQGELWDQRKDGSVFPKWASISVKRNDQGEIENYFASYTDISDKKEAEKKIQYLAHHDSLTGLLNRHSLESRIEQALAEAKRNQTIAAIIMLDVDHFKMINDTLGHHVGDQLLIDVAQRLSNNVRGSDIVGRLGGDEFIICLSYIAQISDAELLLDKVHAALNKVCQLSGRELQITSSAGVSFYPKDGSDANTLMRHADAAMYQAKSMGRNNYQIFSQEMNNRAEERMSMQFDLKNALKLEQFVLHYQPKVHADSKALCGVEALIRWQHPSHGMVPPLKFIPLAEESNLIVDIGAWVIEEACRQMAQWKLLQIQPPSISINLSALQLRSDKLLDQVKASMTKHGIHAGELDMEITESAAMQNPEQAILKLNALRNLGVTLAIDDFGTGYSSLAYLKLLPIHSLKLDRSFVRDIESDENDAAISTATIGLAHNLGLTIVAEGVENEAQSQFLLQQNCDILQGYLYGKPAPAEYWSVLWSQAKTP